MAQGEPGDVFHGPEPGHVVQMDQVLVAEVNLGIGNLLGLVQSLPDHFLTHLWTAVASRSGHLLNSILLTYQYPVSRISGIVPVQKSFFFFYKNTIEFSVSLTIDKHI